jgi:outer membrane beta-barrel protein
LVACVRHALSWILVALPIWVAAQELPGIDLSQPPAGEDRAPEEDEEGRATGRRPAAPNGDGSAQDGRGAAAPLGDPGERDAALDDRVKAVQRKGFLKRGRFEISPLFSASLNDAFYQKLGGSLRLGYHVADSFALAVKGTYYQPLRTSNVREGQVAFQSQLLTSQLDGEAMLQGIWSPVYGKIAFRSKQIVHFDVFLHAGLGAVWTATSGSPRDEGPHLATGFGGGVRFFPNEWLALELGLSATLYPDQPNLAVPSTLQRVVAAGAGFSFFLPTSFDYVYP